LRNKTYIIAWIIGLFGSMGSFASNGTIWGQIRNNNGKPIAEAMVYIEGQNTKVLSDSFGYFSIQGLAYGEYSVGFFKSGLESQKKNVNVFADSTQIIVVLKEISHRLKIATVNGQKEKNFGRGEMGSIDNFGIYEGKKTEVIELSEVTGNTATNNARQVYAKITGLNIWESDGAGLQLGIGGRGLSPNRTANFNVRQNGYDISADALGYPESYYTPPTEALERIELVRGAASLQFGTQFGGMLNFKFKKGPSDKPIELNVRQTIGSWGFFNNFTSAGGTLLKGKLNYYSYFQLKQGNGYRENSGFKAYNGFAAIEYQANKKLKLNLEITKMSYLAQQAGGLTDKNFAQNPRQSLRNRNWFEVDWNMAALHLTYKISENTQLNIRNFGLMAHRNALGNLERINVIDFGGNRTLIKGMFENIGNETRLLHKYKIAKQNQAFVLGTRIYKGKTIAQQGSANNESNADFRFLNPNNIDNSDYIFSNTNYSIFLENIFQIHDKWSITPGIRWEYIQTQAKGYYYQRTLDGAGNIIAENKFEEEMGRPRNFVIAGIGTNYKIKNNLSLYANISQNYRAINFSDIRVVNPNFKVDPNIKDETGYTADMGIKAKKENRYNLEVTAFLVKYNNKIGQILRADQAPLYLDYRFRGNISDARNMGLEVFGEINLIPFFKKASTKMEWTLFVNCAYVDARYINTQDNSIKDKKVEMVPPLMLRTGSQFKYKSFRASFQFAHLSKHYTDATNAILTSTAVEGIIPSYQVADFSMAYKYKRYTFEASVNNLFNQMYYTRRAEGYPGPGIIPSDGRGFFLTLSFVL
jgi:Fe(3+) dicitrate transport protein